MWVQRDSLSRSYRRQYRGRVPELPEVEALVQDLSRRLDGRAVVRVDIAAFSCLKTYDPPITALAGGMVDGVTRHGKFLDIDVSGPHLVLHLARAGWVRWKDEVPAAPPRPSSKSPLAARIVLDDGCRRSTSPRPGPARAWRSTSSATPPTWRASPASGPDPLRGRLHRRGARARSCSGPGGRRSRACCATRAPSPGIGNAYSDEVLHAARMSPFKPAEQPDDERAADVARRDPHRARRRREALRRTGRQRAQGREEEPPGGARPDRARRARSAATPCARSASPTRACSTAPPARPGGSRSPTGACPGC